MMVDRDRELGVRVLKAQSAEADHRDAEAVRRREGRGHVRRLFAFLERRQLNWFKFLRGEFSEGVGRAEKPGAHRGARG